MTDVGFRAHVKIASRIVSYRIPHRRNRRRGWSPALSRGSADRCPTGRDILSISRCCGDWRRRRRIPARDGPLASDVGAARRASSSATRFCLRMFQSATTSDGDDDTTSTTCAISVSTRRSLARSSILVDQPPDRQTDTHTCLLYTSPSPRD